jgi:hypothetical protein
MVKINPLKYSFEITKIKEAKKIVTTLIDNTTIHGIQNVLRTKNLFLKIVWTLFILASICIGIYYIIDSSLDYLKYSTVTTIKVIDEKQAEFPTISVCLYPNLNISIVKTITRLRFDRIDELDINKYFEEFYDPIYGKCMRYNSGINNYNQTYAILNSTRSNNDYGLKIDMNIEIPEMFDLVEILVRIHNKSSPPFEMTSDGYWLATGRWNYFQVERVFSQHLGEPYSGCLKDINSFKRNKSIIDFINSSKRTYSQDDCYYLCSQVYALEESKCGCNSTLSNFDKDCLKHWYDTSENDTKYCVTNYLANFQKKLEYEKCSNFCPLECDSINYLIFLNTETTPYNGYISNMTKNDYSYFNIYSTFKEVHRNYFGVRVFYKDLSYTLISQEPKTEKNDFFINIANILSLVLGISFLSFVEILELFIEIYFIYCKK